MCVRVYRAVSVEHLGSWKMNFLIEQNLKAPVATFLPCTLAKTARTARRNSNPYHYYDIYMYANTESKTDRACPRHWQGAGPSCATTSRAHAPHLLSPFLAFSVCKIHQGRCARPLVSSQSRGKPRHASRPPPPTPRDRMGDRQTPHWASGSR